MIKSCPIIAALATYRLSSRPQRLMPTPF